MNMMRRLPPSFAAAYICIVALVAVTCPDPALASHAPEHAFVDFETVRWSGDEVSGLRLDDSTNQNSFRVRGEGDPLQRHAWISRTMFHSGTQSLGVELTDVEPCAPYKQRVEFELSNADYYPQRMEEQRYYRFSILVHRQSEPIVKPTIFMQAWQNHDVRAARYPPLNLRFIPGNEYHWAVETSKGVTAPGTLEEIFRSDGGLVKDQWNHFVVRFKPSVRQAGAVQVWLNGDLQVGQTHQRDFGYTPQSESPVILDEFQVRVGAYRGRHCVEPPRSRGRTILMFDDVGIGSERPADLTNR
jgi:hypothetical protein